MTKVLCIDAAPRPDSDNTNLESLKEGSTYTIEGTYFFLGMPSSYYFHEIPGVFTFKGQTFRKAYNVSRFVPLSEINEPVAAETFKTSKTMYALNQDNIELVKAGQAVIMSNGKRIHINKLLNEIFPNDDSDTDGSYTFYSAHSDVPTEWTCFNTFPKGDKRKIIPLMDFFEYEEKI